MIFPDWSGLTAVLIASGPSLDLRQIYHVGLARQRNAVRTIAVKDNVIVCGGWLDWMHFRWQLIPGLKKISDEIVVRTAPIRTQTFLPQWGAVASKHIHPLFTVVTPELDGYAPKFSGAQALALLAHTGVSRVILLGVDCTFAGPCGRTSWHGNRVASADYPRGQESAKLSGEFEALAELLRARKVAVVNCSPGSQLGCFENVPLQTTLPG